MKLPSLGQLIQAVRVAAYPIRRDFRTRHRIKTKNDGTLVTDTDLEVYRNFSLWTKQYPAIGLICEEGNVFSTDQQYVLCVDPLDGTSAFIDGVAAATVAVALMKRETDDRWYPLQAIIHDPITSMTWATEGSGPTILLRSAGRGAEEDEASVALGAAPYQVTISTWPGVGFNLDRVEERVRSDRRRFAERQYGSIAIVAGLIASGVRHASVFAGSSAIETAAMSLIVRNAGGVATDLFGEPLDGYVLGEHNGKLDFLLPNGAIMSASRELTDQLVSIVVACNEHT